MKKILLLLVLPFVFAGCKQNSKHESVSGSDSIVVDTLSTGTGVKAKAFASITADTCDYYQSIKTETAVNQVAWLKTNKDEICGNDEYLKCLVRYHKITETEYNNAVTAYWVAEPAKYTNFTYNNFTGQACDFVKYYIFTVDTRTHTISKSLKGFNAGWYNYSIPFFKGLPLEFTEVNAATTLKFTQGKIDGTDRIMFKIDGVAGAYFDFSHHPSGNVN